MDFNRPAEQRAFRYERNPISERGFLILKRSTHERYDPVGDYMVVDAEEDIQLSEKKVMNLVALLNADNDYIMDLGELTGAQSHFHIKPEKTERGQTQMVFFELGEQGVSKQNAVLSIDEGMLE
jgi:hypothetical protein|tara:strand:+ start:434 stop:805 length:372 start_codon:yes stop_codon:yes gene_type:complete